MARSKSPAPRNNDSVAAAPTAVAGSRFSWQSVRAYLIALLTEYRGVVIVCFCLPASFVFGLYFQLRDFVYQTLLTSPAQHDARVAGVQAAVRRWAAQPDAARAKRPMCTDRAAWLNVSTRFAPKEKWHKIRMGNLRDVLGLDTERGVVRVEPGVDVGAATRYLVPRGYMLKVTLEIAEATLGGLCMAVGMTTHSHRAGLIQDTVEAFEVVLADGSLVRATRTNAHADLFHALPWSHGTLGLLVALELQVMPVKPYVRVRYTPLRGQDRYVEAITRASLASEEEGVADFVEATIFSKESAVLMEGTFSDAPCSGPLRGWLSGAAWRAWLGQVNYNALWYKPWFFKHVESMLRANPRDDRVVEEFLPLAHYLLRHDRAIFWTLQARRQFCGTPADCNESAVFAQRWLGCSLSLDAP